MQHTTQRFTTYSYGKKGICFFSPREMENPLYHAAAFTNLKTKAIKIIKESNEKIENIESNNQYQENLSQVSKPTASIFSKRNKIKLARYLRDLGLILIFVSLML
ncbi:hypothetical protein MNBD_GAMMA11-1338 [hydrothermal vent metagenome]|uniref:Uncharacterized protein n=1 Tax=hydrothermal vent metagenome TaxID=652676 RepID=A0A3B0Y7Y6_9ZZZZ